MNGITAMMEFTEILKKTPRDTLDFISANGYLLNKNDLLHIVKELLYSIYANLYVCDRERYNCIHEDAGIELDEIYDDEYKEEPINDQT